MFIKKISNNKKITYIIMLSIILFMVSIGIPTIARFNNRVMINDVNVWDGSISTSYKSGTGIENDPYIISNGSELAYFSSMLETNDYENTYFELSNDIVLNNGIFNYDNINGIEYTLNNITYYIDYYNNTYYDNINRYGSEIGTVNMFNSLDNFKGYFDGTSHRIYGLYIADENKEKVALFTNLSGSISNLYVENSVIYGGMLTAGVISDATNSTLKNVVFNGDVVGKTTGLTKNIAINPNVDSINLSTMEQTNYIDLTNKIPFVGSEIISTSITGNYVINDSSNSITTIKINGVIVSGGSFEIDLGTTILDTISVITQTNSASNITLTFSNLTYNITYKHAITSGIIGLADNVTLENVVNKGSIIGYSVASGIVGTSIDALTLNKTYNSGLIMGTNITSGLIGVVEKSSDPTSITKSYNNIDITGSTSGGIIGVLNNNMGLTTITNTFNASNNCNIGSVVNSILTVSNSYYTGSTTSIGNGSINGTFENTTIDNLKLKTYGITNMLFNEFVSFSDLEQNSENAWIYEEGYYPILFIDDISDPDANIIINNYIWNNFSTELNTIKLNSNVSFVIEGLDNVAPLSDIKYYINNSNVPLTEQEISTIAITPVLVDQPTWKDYTNIEEIVSEGYHIIYARVVDQNGNVSYLNSDILLIDKTIPTGGITFNGITYTNLRNSLNSVYINKNANVTISGMDILSDVSIIKYYIGNEILDEESLNNLNNTNWTTYINEITLNEIGKYIIYAKIIDNCSNATYINTDYIIYDGYNHTSLILGTNEGSYIGESKNITNKSSITSKFTYSGVSNNFTNIIHNLKTNILLPLATKITLIDHITNKVYEYEILSSSDLYNYNNSCLVSDLLCEKIATYPFTLFKEVGSGIDKQYVENNYIVDGNISEEFDVILDFKNTTIVRNYSDVKLYIELEDNGGVIRPTLNNTTKTFNIYYNNVAADLYLNTDYNLNPINLNDDSTTNININTGITYKYENSNKVIDTTYENKIMGLSIKIVDINGTTVNRNYLRNVRFKIGNTEYYMGTDNIVRINLKSGINNISKTLSVITKDANVTLLNGMYYLKISNYASYNGYYYNSLNDETITVPISLTNSKYKSTYGFNVLMNNENRIVDKTNAESNLSFNIIVKTAVDNPNVKVKLYKKVEMTAYNQDYEMVDLASYISNTLEMSSANTYYVTNGPIQYNGTVASYNSFALNLITANFENNSYKLVFELYNGTQKIDSVEKTFIVK